MIMKERNKFLTEVVGECWHEPKIEGVRANSFVCGKCNTIHCCGIENPNYSTWEGFGKLWEWSIYQDWFEDFAKYHGQVNHILMDEPSDILIHIGKINPNKFADAIYNSLKSR